MVPTLGGGGDSGGAEGLSHLTAARAARQALWAAVSRAALRRLASAPPVSPSAVPNVGLSPTGTVEMGVLGHWAAALASL